jgi:hypothetical protein
MYRSSSDDSLTATTRHSRPDGVIAKSSTFQPPVGCRAHSSRR